MVATFILSIIYTSVFSLFALIIVFFEVTLVNLIPSS